MKSLKNFLTAPAFVVAFISILLMSAVLLIPPIIGLADDGSFIGILSEQGMYKLDRYEEDQYYDYFNSKYGIYEYFNEYSSNTLSSQAIFIKAAKVLNNIFSSDKLIFDIRYLSILLILYCAFSIYLLVDYASYKKSKFTGYLIGLLCVFIFVDTGYSAYFNSFYAEGLIFVALLAAIGSALLMTQNRYRSSLLILSILINGLIAMGAKRQTIPIGILLGFLCIFFAWRDSIKNKNSAKKAFRTFALFSGIFLCTANLAFYIFAPNNFSNVNKYHAMTRGAMQSSKNPEKSLEFFDINSQYSILNNSIYYEKYPSVDVDSEILKENFYSKYNFLSIFTYYFAHPQELFYMLGKAGENAYAIRPEILGNYEKTAGFQPGEKTQFFSLYSALKKMAVPKTAGFFVIWIILVVLLNFKNKTRMVVFVFIMLIGLLQIAISIIEMGDADLGKHLFLFNVAFDVVVFAGISALISNISQKFSAKYTISKQHNNKKV